MISQYVNGIIESIQAILHSRLLLGFKRDSDSHYWTELQAHSTVTVSTSEVFKIEDEMRYEKTLKAPTSTTNKQEKEKYLEILLKIAFIPQIGGSF